MSRYRRRGSTNSLTVLVVVSLLIMSLLVLALRYGTGKRTPETKDQLFLYCAAGLRYPVEQVVQDYREEYGVTVEIQYGGSATLLSQLAVAKTGDLYLAADHFFIDEARKKGLAAEVIPLATMRPVIIVRKDSDKTIETLDDLLQPGLRVGLGNPDAAAIGERVRSLLEDAGQWEAMEKQVATNGVFKPTVNEVANDVKLGSIDAGIVWDSTAAQYPELRAVHDSLLDQGRSAVEITVLESTEDATAALRFARFLAARDRGLPVLESMNFDVVDGDKWSEVPELVFYIGSVNKRAIEPVIIAFEEREGVQITTDYNGCGILTSKMKVIKDEQRSGFPDTYMACDVYYLENVKEWFQDAVNVSDTDIVIAVQKGNPKNITGVKDLLKPGVRVAIGQPEQCTIGALTRILLDSEGIYEELLETNVVTQTATSALLVPAVTSKSADAVLAYKTDTLAERDKLDVVELSSKKAKAIQPYSIARSSEYKYVGRRLFEAITRSQDSFESAGFNWRLDAKPSAEEQQAAGKSTEAP
jgi:molybdenum ABC transporter molybdate-binding protein